MILYGNKQVIRQVFHWQGSIIHGPRTLGTGIFLACLAIFVRYLMQSNNPWAPIIPHYYAISAFVSILSFATVFRATLAWQKYWEALGECQKMYSKWADVFMQYSVFARGSAEMAMEQGDEEGVEKAARVLKIYNSVHKHFSLLSAMALDRLAHGDLEIMNHRATQGKWKDQVTTRTKLGFEIGHGDPRQIKASRHLPSFVLRKDFDPGHDWRNTYLVEELPSGAEVIAMADAEDRVGMITTWIIAGLAKASKDLDVAPPIQSRMYQEMSNASLAFLNCVKIADTPFPFPYSQVLVYLLLIFSACVPVIAASVSSSMLMSAVVSFFLFLSFWTINLGALELEAPFGSDTNDIPLDDFHLRFCKSLSQVHTALDVVHYGTVDGVSTTATDFEGRSTALIPIRMVDLPSSDTAVRPPTATSNKLHRKGPYATVTGEAGLVKDTAAHTWRSALPELEAGVADSRSKAAPVIYAVSSDREASLPEGKLRADAEPKLGAVDSHKQVRFHRGNTSELIDRQLAQIGEVMERHLANIGREIDTLARRNEELRESQDVDALIARRDEIDTLSSRSPRSPRQGLQFDSAGAYSL